MALVNEPIHHCPCVRIFLSFLLRRQSMVSYECSVCDIRSMACLFIFCVWFVDKNQIYVLAVSNGCVELLACCP